ncbi:DNA alkylation repair protein [Candidatus Micrarchaeota archaeon]|nr:DNA alkylation repair protein [Candidatus Micrarchaeota archaeon]
MNYSETMKKLKSYSNPKNVQGMSRFGIKGGKMLGISIPILRKMSKEIGKDHALALELWNSGIHEARILASMIDDPKLVTEKQMDSWVSDFDSWDVCDQVCMNLFGKVPSAYKKIGEWAKREEEFVRRTAFSMIAVFAWQKNGLSDNQIIKLIPLIKKYSTDERNFVKKAVNWALRQIGKRNLNLNTAAIKTAKEIQKLDSKSAKWIATDALRELTNEKTLARIKKK